jgi:hypothetical protein
VELGDEKFPVLRLLLSSTSEKEEVDSLVEILARKEFRAVWSQARQAIREIDYSFFGPQAKA